MIFSFRENWPQELLRWVFMAMEISWLAIVFWVLEGLFVLAGAPSLAWLVLLYLPGYLLGLVVLRLKWPFKIELPFVLSAAVLTLSLLVKIFILPGAAWLDSGLVPTAYKAVTGSSQGLGRLLVILLGGGFMWLRGWYLAGKQAGAQGVLAGFQAGLAGLLVGIFFISRFDTPLGSPAWLIASFFFFGLTGICQARLLDLAPDQRPGRLFRLVFILPALTGLIVLMGLGLWAVFDRHFLEIIFQPLFWIWDLLGRLFHFLMSLFPEPEPMNLPPQAGLPPMNPTGPIKPPWDFAWLRKAGEIAFMTGTLGLVLGALFRFLQDLLRWFRRRWDLDEFGVVESLETGFFDDLFSVMKMIYRFFLALGEKVAQRFGHKKRDNWENLAIRRLYKRLLKWGALKGYPRSGGQTPFEYLTVIIPALPESSREYFVTITEIYVRIRYGPPKPCPEDIDLVRACWRRIKSGGLKKRRPEPIPNAGEFRRDES